MKTTNNNNKSPSKKWVYTYQFFFFIGIVLSLIFISGVGSAYQIENEKIIQIEIDENYPCYLINEINIICDQINQSDLNTWITNINNSEESQIDKNSRIELLQRNVTYEGYKDFQQTEKSIIINRTVILNREEMKTKGKYTIGFNTNIFELSNEPLAERFIINLTSGNITYSPYNKTWLLLDNETNKNKAIWFDVDDITVKPNNITYMFWFNTTETPVQRRNILERYVWGIALNSNKTPEFRVGRMYNSSGNHSTISNSSIIATENEWNHIVAIYNPEKINNGEYNTTIKLYYNGNLSIESNIGNLTYYEDYGNISGKYVKIGTTNHGTWYPFKGGVTEVRIYNRSLTPTEIENIYNQKLNILPSYNSNGLILNWRMGYNYSSQIYDSSGNNRTLTLQNNVTWENDGIDVNTKDYITYLKIINLVKGLIFYDNKTIIVNNYNGNRSIGFLNKESIIILDNYNLTEGVIRENNPLSLSGTSTSKTITSSLSQSINATVIVNAECESVGNAVYQGIPITPQSCSNDKMTFILTEIPAGNSLLTLNLNKAILDICDASDTSFLETSQLAGMILTIILIGGVLAITFLSFSGVGGINLGSFKPADITLNEIIGGILVIGLTFLIIATLAFLIGGSYCPAIT